MILVTFHGGNGTNGAAVTKNINNVYAYDETASPPTEYQDVLHTGSSGVELSELRGMLLVEGILYVANGSKTVSNVLGFTQDSKAAAPKFHQPQPFIPMSTTIDHPFAFTFANSSTQGQLSWWVSNQDSNVVALLTAPAPTSKAPFSPANPLGSGPAGTFLQTLLTNLKQQPTGTFSFLPGSFVASDSNEPPLPDVTPVDPSWGGLDVSIGPKTSDDSDEDQGKKKPKEKNKVLNSVRGVLYDNGILYVADEVANLVRMYDPNTGIIWGHASATSPVHLSVQDGYLYVSTSDGVYYGECPSPPTSNLPGLPAAFRTSDYPIPPYPAPPEGYDTTLSLTLSKLSLDPEPKGPSGITFDTDGNLYVASRKGQAIYKYVPQANSSPPAFVTPSGATQPLITTEDQPEFLLWYA